MPICPQCLFLNPDGAVQCSRCGELRFPADGNQTPAPSFAMTLPEPMVEPIHTPSKMPQDHEPVPENSALSRSVREATSEPGTGLAMPSLGAAAPSALTVRQRSANPNRSDVTPSPEGPSAVSVLESRVTKVSPRASGARTRPRAGRG